MVPGASIRQTIEALRAVLLRVEKTAVVGPDNPDFAALKRIILNRIGDLEFAQVKGSRGKVQHKAAA